MTHTNFDINNSQMPRVGIVVIGRNEGERLVRCLASLDPKTHPVVYVDSASTDESVRNAEQAGADVIQLDMSTPFTAARARNQGWRHLKSKYPNLVYIQFIDGDCEMLKKWLNAATSFLDINPNVGVVFGTLIEKFPNASIYNYMCNAEWKRPSGEAYGCGGIALMRLDVLVQVKGYNERFIASEEADLCIRMRKLDFIVVKINVDMALHDAAILLFSQWWKRCVRSGFSFALLAESESGESSNRGLRGCIRPFIWSGIPVIILVLGLISPIELLLFVYFPLQLIRMFIQKKDLSVSGLKSSFFNLLSKFPEAIGVIKYLRSRLNNKSTAIIEYK